jgi:methyl-CpG-binding domain protein 4
MSCYYSLMEIERYPKWPTGRNKMIQEIFREEPWKLLAGCILLNQTTHVQVRQVIWELFQLCPTPEAMASADPEVIARLIRPLGFYNRRARNLIRFAQSWLGEWSDPRELHGIGRYAHDSWQIFIDGRRDIVVTDKVLTRYLAEDWHLDQIEVTSCHP